MVRAFTGAHDANWIPLTWLSHMLDCQWFGLNSGWHHLTTVFLHAISTLLVFALFMRMTGARWASAFVAFAFALHPLHVESVAWVAERKDALSAVFFLAALIAYVMYVERPSVLRYGLVAGLFACGLMSKPMVVTLPLVALLLDFWPLKRSKPLSSLIVEKIPLFALSIGASIVAYVVQAGAGAVAAADQVPMQIRLENAVISYVVYLEKFVWPSNLAIVYPYLIPATWQWVLAGLALLSITVLILRERVRRPYLVVGWLWFLGMLAPVIGVVQVGLQSHADRYTYLPSIGISIMVAWGSAELFRQRRLVLGMAGAAVCSAWALVTWSDLDYWQNTVTLFEHAIQVTDGNYVAYNNLGVALKRQGRVAEAIQDFETAQRLRPEDAELQDNLGEALLTAGRIDEAVPHLSEAIRLRPDYVKGHIDAGSAFMRTGQTSLAEAQYREALRLDRGSAEAHYGLGSVLALQGRVDEARPHFEVALPHVMESVAMNPGDADGHYNLGTLFTFMGRTGEAIQQFSETVRLAPEDAEAHFNLGVALFQTGRVNEAVEQFAATVRLRPEDVNAHYNLAKTLAASGRSQEAAAEYKEREAHGYEPGAGCAAAAWGGRHLRLRLRLARDRSNGFVLSYAPYANRNLPGSGGGIRLLPGHPAKEVGFGMRNPYGWCSGPEGEVFFTDNQGEWVATNKLCHLVEGRFNGFPNPDPEAACFKTGGQDDHLGALRLGAVDQRRRLRQQRRQVRAVRGAILPGRVDVRRGHHPGPGGEGERRLPGRCFPFWGKGLLGPLCLTFDPKGRLWVGSITEPGWMAQPDRGALYRIDWTGKTPFEIQSIHVLPARFPAGLHQTDCSGQAQPGVVPDRALPLRVHRSVRFTGTGPGGIENRAPRDGGRRPKRRTDHCAAAEGPGLPDHGPGSASAAGEALVHPTGAYTLHEVPPGR